MKLLLNPEFQLYEKDGKPFCNSLQVAETFEKRHDNVLRDTRNTLATIAKTNNPKFGLINFQLSSYKNSQGRKQPMYLYTKVGFAYLVFGFEGEKAAELKINYITNFIQREAFENFITECLISTGGEHEATT